MVSTRAATKRMGVMNALELQRSNVSLRDAQTLLEGRELRRYMEAWTWSAARFSGEPARRQGAWFNRFGFDSLLRRQNRIRQFLGFRLL